MKNEMEITTYFIIIIIVKVDEVINGRKYLNTYFRHTQKNKYQFF